MAIITIDENKYLTNFYTGPGWIVENGIEIEDDNLEAEFFNNTFSDYQYIDGKIIKDEAKAIITKTEQRVEELRGRRKTECFPIINRGDLWYSRLTEEQLNELNIWYDAWLNVTETLIIPEKPDWLE